MRNFIFSGSTEVRLSPRFSATKQNAIINPISYNQTTLGLVTEMTMTKAKKCEKWIKEYLGSGSRVVNSSGDEHPALAVNDQSPMVVAHIEWLEEIGPGKLNNHQIH